MSKTTPSKQDLVALFHLPISAAAQELGVSVNVIKRLCRKFGMEKKMTNLIVPGIERWPYRKVHALSRKLESLQKQSWATPDVLVAQMQRAAGDTPDSLQLRQRSSSSITSDSSLSSAGRVHADPVSQSADDRKIDALDLLSAALRIEKLPSQDGSTASHLPPPSSLQPPPPPAAPPPLAVQPLHAQQQPPVFEQASLDTTQPLIPLPQAPDLMPMLSIPPSARESNPALAPMLPAPGLFGPPEVPPPIVMRSQWPRHSVDLTNQELQHLYQRFCEFGDVVRSGHMQ